MEGLHSQLVMGEQHRERPCETDPVRVCGSGGESGGTAMMAVGHVEDLVLEQRLDDHRLIGTKGPHLVPDSVDDNINLRRPQRDRTESLQQFGPRHMGQ